MKVKVVNKDIQIESWKFVNDELAKLKYKFLDITQYINIIFMESGVFAY